jgi:hypothetical protein
MLPNRALLSNVLGCIYALSTRIRGTWGQASELDRTTSTRIILLVEGTSDRRNAEAIEMARSTNWLQCLSSLQRLLTAIFSDKLLYGSANLGTLHLSYATTCAAFTISRKSLMRNPRENGMTALRAPSSLSGQACLALLLSCAIV